MAPRLTAGTNSELLYYGSGNEGPTLNKILIVEDEYLISSWLEEALQDEGHTVLIAGDADQAVTSLNLDEDIDLLFTDVDMPGSMNGMELASMVNDRWPSIGIIVASGKPRPDHPRLPQGAKFLQKPFRLEDVIDAMRHVGGGVRA